MRCAVLALSLFVWLHLVFVCVMADRTIWIVVNACVSDWVTIFYLSHIHTDSCFFFSFFLFLIKIIDDNLFVSFGHCHCARFSVSRLFKRNSFKHHIRMFFPSMWRIVLILSIEIFLTIINYSTALCAIFPRFIFKIDKSLCQWKSHDNSFRIKIQQRSKQ